jgi:hypothetical protein
MSDLQPSSATDKHQELPAASQPQGKAPSRFHDSPSLTQDTPDPPEEADTESDQDEAASVTGAILEVWEDQATMQYLQTEQYNVDLLPDDDVLLSREMKRIDKRAANYRWCNDNHKLYFRPSGKYTTDREVPSPAARETLIDQMHLDLGHLGTTKLCSILLSRYYWRGIYNQVKQRLRNCVDCLRHKTLFKFQPELKPLPPSQLWERVSLDSMGPYPPTRNGCRFLCVGIDGMSKYVEAQAVPKLDADTMCRFVMNQIIANHGTPKTIISDGGKEFQFGFKTLMKELGVEHLQTAAYNPQSNGQAEAAVKTILHGLQKTVGDNPHAWDEKLPLVLLGLRSAVHSTTGFSPFYVNTGRNPILPAQRRGPPAPTTDQAGPSSRPRTRRTIPATAATAAAGTSAQSPTTDQAGPSSRPRTRRTTPATAATAAAGTSAQSPPAATDEEEEDDGLDQMLDQGTRRLIKQRNAHKTDLHQTLENNILRSQAKQKRDFKARHLHVPAPEDAMPPGSLVLMFCPPKNKLAKVNAIEGPYLLVKYLSNSRALLEDAQHKQWACAINRLAPFGSSD